jgi:hypothetical protein
MKINESITSDLKNKIGTEMSNAGVFKNGSEGMMAYSDFTKSLGEDKNVVTKKSMKKKTKISKEENKEATGAGSAGSVEGLFSATKKEMEEGQIKKVEATEGTGAGASSGSYETTSFLAKSQSKKDWRGKSKTQIPGGKFVQVKKKCQKFPYCNQGDIKALKIFENEKVKKAIQNISERHNISENVIKTIIAYEYENTFSK